MAKVLVVLQNDRVIIANFLDVINTFYAIDHVEFGPALTAPVQIAYLLKGDRPCAFDRLEPDQVMNIPIHTISAVLPFPPDVTPDGN